MRSVRPGIGLLVALLGACNEDALVTPPDQAAMPDAGGDFAVVDLAQPDTAVASCSDGVQDGDETDVDCGGATCAGCAVGRACLVDGDCASLACKSQLCVPPHDWFAAARDYPVGSAPAFAAIADLDGDKVADLAVTWSGRSQPGPGHVAILRGVGDGTFTDGGSFGAGTSAHGIAAGDLDGDGDTDLVVTNWSGMGGTPDGLLTFLGDGKGGFTKAAVTTCLPQTYAVVLGDYDADGKRDAACVGASGALLVRYGDGKGGFGAVFQRGMSIGAPSAGAAGDLDGDGRHDLVVLNGATVDVVLAAPGRTFQPAVGYSGTFTDVVVRDFNGDGKLDVAASANQGAEVTLFTGDGKGDLGAPVAFGPMDAAAMGLAVGDFNGDGRADLAALDGKGANLFLNDGKGQLGATARYLAHAPLDGAAGDLDGDKRTELVLVNDIADEVRVLRARAGGALIDAPVFAEAAGVHRVAIADFDGDGAPDVAANHVFDGDVVVRRGDGKGGLGAATVVAAALGAGPLAAADVDHDGDVDLIAGTVNQVAYLRNDGKGGFVVAAKFGVGDQLAAIPLADLDGDGRLDLVAVSIDSASIAVFFGNNAGSFDAATYVPSGVSSPSGGAVADFDGDGQLDLAFVDGGTPTLHLLINAGARHFVAGKTTTFPTTAYSFAAADLDGDGKVDLFAGASDGETGSALFLRGNGDGTFMPAVSYPIARSPTQVILADLDGDNLAEAIVVDAAGAEAAIFRNGKKGISADGQRYGALRDVTGAAVGDLDGDGRPDLVFGGGGGVAVLINTMP